MWIESLGGYNGVGYGAMEYSVAGHSVYDVIQFFTILYYAIMHDIV